ncbi:conserved hypothetical protein [Leishmania major strain Friedlin]|uniref:Uncharacterized protein n=1 Tax=Leishmania major TaxID=5664 RepID=Q4QDN9_LEIMA|nr:conserved hypothetical protein [Leishmania major strain Friedlin]CAG9572538.1 hypothetical_protein_-_conserved [Leishmania major strain Friedlin]CAJ04279.1 conserved hypothetical protein [Leishmania major strain Friedlin]|eukprot:XP_001682559.1 conserved hypothetical protein [Leishmania major strain Friedlin]
MSGATGCTVRTYSAPAYEHEEGADDDEGDYLQAYEELLLNAASNAVADDAAPQPGGTSSEGLAHVDEEAGAHVDGAFPYFESPASVPAPADALVEDTLAALPADGSTVLLTDLARSLDVEAISELFGSVRSFVQLHPHLLTCTQDPDTGRWHVARRCSSTSPLNADAATAAAPDLASAIGGGEEDDHKAVIVGLDVAAMVLAEDLRHLCGSRYSSKTRTHEAEAAHSAVKRSRRRLIPVAVPNPLSPTSDTGAAHDGASLTTPERAWWPTIASLLPEDGTPLPISVLRASLPGPIAQELRARQVGLARCFKQTYATASHHVALTADSTALVRAAVQRSNSCAAASVLLWSPERQKAAAWTNHKESSVAAFSSCLCDAGDGSYVSPPADYDASQDAEPWLVTISLDDGEEAGPEEVPPESGDVDEGALGRSADAATALAAATGLQEIPYNGLSGASRRAATQVHGTGLQPHDLNLERLYDAPAPPTAVVRSKPSTATQLAGPAGAVRTARPTRPSTPAEWLALHTAMAEARGWITPMQMLDYLVECVPTFFIPVEELRPSDAILKLVGARTSMRTLVSRVYMYFVERSEDKMQIRLAPTVEHAQRGAANAHYAAWNPDMATKCEQRGVDAAPSEAPAPADAFTGTAANPGDRQDSVTHSGARSGGTVLQSSDATKAFPVMRVRRPIKSLLSVRSFKAMPATAKAAASPAALPTAVRLSSPDVQAGASTGSGSSSTPTVLKSGGGFIALSSVPTGEIGYPFLALATQPVHTWPWWARLLCVLPFDTYVPLDHLRIHYCPDLAPENVHLAWRAADASFLPTTSSDKACTPIPFSLLRAPTASRSVRLRPFWLSPGCTSELESTVMPVGLVKQLRPVWLPVSRLLSKLTPEEREESLALAIRRPSAAGLSVGEALVMLLRDCGRCCWVQEDGAKVRRYAASSALDDHFHASLSLLYGFSSARAWEPLPAVLDRASEHVRSLFAHSQAPPLASPNTVGLIGMLRQAPPAELKGFLTRHAQWLEVKATDDRETSNEAAAPLLVRRRAALVSF